MKISLNWLKEYVSIPDDIDLTRLAYDLTMTTVEVEDCIELSSKFNDMVIGVVRELLPHPNADKLVLCKTDVGDGEIKEIVCGGTNLSVGMKVAVAKPGAMVRWHGEGELVPIGLAKVRGVESYGMICASSEIGLFDLFPNTDEATIVDLSEFDVNAGTPLAEALGLTDTILEIDNKSLTNRPDLWGHYGIAREISALYDLPLSEHKSFVPPSGQEEFMVEIADAERCPRYIGVRMNGLTTKPAPFEIRSRIWRVGMRPSNAIVDITNYIMLATGQPTHAFDADRIKGNITVRRAHDEEKLLLLSGKELTLSGDDLVIADDTEAVALAGIMGGEKDSILDDTTNVILEIANFEALGVRRTATKYDTRTEAAARYEKAIDPERADLALSMSMSMFEQLFPNMTISGFHDNYVNRLIKSEIDVSLVWLNKRLGKNISNDDIASRLSRLGFEVTFRNDIAHVTAPSWRSTGDVAIPDDIIEEIARMYGFDNFEMTPITTAFSSAVNQPAVNIDRKIREYLAFRCGMSEVYTYPWMNDLYLDALFPGQGDMLSISTPPSPTERYIRFSLLPNLTKAVSDNLRFFDEFAIFESAQVFSNKEYSSQYNPRELLPVMRRSAAGAWVGVSENVVGLFRTAKGVLEALPRYIHAESIQFEQIEKPSWADDVLWLNIISCGRNIGDLGLVSKKAALECGIKNASVMLFELNIDALVPFPSRNNEFEHLPEYPMTDYDVSMMFDLPVKWEDIFTIITGKRSSDSLLQNVTYIDEYRGRQVPEGKKSVTFRLMIGSLKKTLTSDEIDGCANAIIKRLTKTLGASLRS